MAPTAAVIIPTHRRAGYLDVALRSIGPQAQDAGTEVVVVLDGPDDASRAVARRHGARVVALDSRRGLNAARNAGVQATDAALLVFADDDVAVRPGWLRALLDADDRLAADYGVLTGPIHGRIENPRFRMCGREGPPVTFQELGGADRDVDFGWGANMALRRSALVRIGDFDESIVGGGDESEWQLRLRAAGGRIRYVAAAAVDHRRAGGDARVPALARVAYRRGREVRRFDVRRGAPPPLAGELRVLAGCLWHGPRRLCANGPVMAAHSLGRVHEALAPRPSATTPDFLSGTSGTVGGRRGELRRVADAALDALDVLTLRRARLGARARRRPPRRRVLVLGVERPGMLMDGVRAELARSRHDVTVTTAPVGGRGKFENLNALLAAQPAAGFDWVLVIDDDVDLPPRFLDRFLCAVEDAGLRVAQPAHRLHSHAAWPVTRRRPLVAARETTFVEIGPVTAFHRDTFDVLLPFPQLRMGWGLDAHWSAVARAHGWPIGVVDAVPVGHTLRPAAAGYGRAEAEAEARAFLADRPYVRRDEVRTLVAHR